VRIVEGTVRELDVITGQIISAAMKVHSRLGPGLLESTYQACLQYELIKRGLAVAVQVGLPVVYEEVKIQVGYRLDLVVNDAVIVELKAVEAIHPTHRAQLLSYLRLSNKRVGLLLNFNVRRLKDGIYRVVNTY
jgi:GxxExxY protein